MPEQAALALPPTLKLSRLSACIPTVIALLPHLMDGRDFVLEGWIRFSTRGWWHEHTWMQVDGQVYDPSIIQFKRLKTYSASPFRDILRRIPCRLYKEEWMLSINEFWRKRLKEFGVIYE